MLVQLHCMESFVKSLQESKDRKYSKGLEEESFGTSDTRKIVNILGSSILENTGETIKNLLFFSASAALVYGITLSNEDKVVLKIFPKDWDLEPLKRSRKIQEELFGRNYPVTEPRGGVFKVFNSFATVDSYETPVDTQEDVDGRLVLAMSKELCKLTKLLSDSSLEADLEVESQFGWTDNQRWGKQVRPEINLDDRPEGAEWIEDMGKRAREMASKPQGRKVIAHDDWLPHNVKINRNYELELVYDWDSLCLGIETIFVGKACLTGAGEDINLFIESYEKEADYKFNKEELRTIAGTALWMRAFLARWEHSQSSEATGYLRERLKKDSEVLLSLRERD